MRPANVIRTHPRTSPATDPGSELVPPRLSIVVPARDAERSLPRCLQAATRSAGPSAEIIVVDDGSRDRTAEIARRHGAIVIRQDRPSGPAAARNAGAARARGDVLLFLDADVVLAADGVAHVLRTLERDPGLAAVFGSYDDTPAVRTLVSEYRNLLHHFVHQTSEEDSGSFWAGCGAIRRRVFEALGGFDERYRRPSIEDIELGGRLARAGHRVRLEKRLRVTHLKRWTVGGIILADVRDRAYPWARLILDGGRIPADLNLRREHRASAVLVWLGVLLALALPLASGSTGRGLLVVALTLVVAGLLVLNRTFYRFLVDRRGLSFAARAVPLHLLYYAYASATFGWCWVSRRWSRRPATS
jgi:glycosyltransferase involved in cell wall biosynthesis